jgi:uncharacterized protein (TIGR02246 family)
MTNRLSACLITCLLCTSLARADDDRAATIKRLEDSLVAAFNKYDAAALERLWADDLTFVMLNGSVASKAQRLAGLKPIPANIPQSANESVDVRFYGDAAVAVVLSKWDLTVDGKPVTSHYRATHVWAQHDGRWQLIAAQVTQVKTQ